MHKMKSSYGKPISSRVVSCSWIVRIHGVERVYTLTKRRDHRRVHGVIICIFCDSFLLYQTILVIRLSSGQTIIKFSALCLCSNGDIQRYDYSSLVRSHAYFVLFSLNIMCYVYVTSLYFLLPR